MPGLCERRISQVGGSKVIPLPLDWIRALNLDHGYTVQAVYDSILIIAPPTLKFDIDHIIYELKLLASFKGGQQKEGNKAWLLH
jgi:antitoxin component of MazEF toxin-antitoxin module